MEQAIAMIFWLGQSCFVIQTPETTILTDPFNERMGYSVTRVEGVDVVTVSHEHGDHNNVAMAAGEPIVLRGLGEGGKSFSPVERKINDVRIVSVNSYHDESEGQKRGRNAIFVFEIAVGDRPVRLVHMGDFGEPRLSEEQAKAIGRPDLLMLPVGGYYTIGAPEANRIIEKLRPRVVVPMHWKTSKTARLPIADAAPFLEGKQHVVRDGPVSGNRLLVTRSLLERADKAGEALIAPLEFGPPPEPRRRDR